MMDDIQKRGDGIVMQTLKQLLGSLDILNEQKQQQLIGLQQEKDQLQQRVDLLEEDIKNRIRTIGTLTQELAMLKAKVFVDAPS